MVRTAVIILVIILLSPLNIHAQEYGYIEIFDINQGRVINTMQSTPDIQKLAVSYLHGISGIYGKFDPVPNSGFAVRIPLSTSVHLQRKGMNAYIDRVIIMFPENEQPFLMIFETENNLLCFTFKGDTDKLLKLLNYETKSSH